MIQELFFALLGLVAGVVLVWMFFKKSAGADKSVNQEALLFQTMISERLDKMMHQMDVRLHQNMQAMNESKSFLADRVSSAERTVREVSMGLGRMEEATRELHKTNKDIANFQQMLRSPKVRGGFGEVLLGNLLADVLPQDRYELQYTFPDSGEIADSIIRLQDGYIVAVDAKFPLANYELYVREEDSERKASLRKVFIRDVKKHITDIAKKYISPQEKTLDFAYMYIPVEGVYYETMVHDREGSSLWEFCFANKVIPVSPNSFLGYLQTILVGLRGMKIEARAKEILETLGQVRKDFKVFAQDYQIIGTHLTNAKNKYDDSTRRLDKFTNRLDQIESNVEVKIPELGERSRQL